METLVHSDGGPVKKGSKQLGTGPALEDAADGFGFGE